MLMEIFIEINLNLNLTFIIGSDVFAFFINNFFHNLYIFF